MLYFFPFLAGSAIPGMNAYEKNGLKIDFEFERSPVDGVLSINLTASNANPAPMSDFVFQAAVPKVSRSAIKVRNDSGIN